MDQIPDSSAAKNRRRLPGISRVLGCFGRVSKNKPPGKKNSKTIANKKSSWLNFSRNKSKKSPRKTVPLDSTSDGKGRLKKDICWLRKSAKEKCSFSDQLRSEEKDCKKGIPALEETNCNSDKGINLGNGKSNTTCKQGASKCTSSTTLNISHANPQPSNCLLHSISSPHIYYNPINIPKNIQDNEDEELQEKKDMGFDQLFGMSIVTIALVIMIMWGKLCAILCGSAYLYIYPFLRTKIEQNVVQKNDTKSGELDTNTQEYKKKVVFKGILERDRRSI